MENNNKILDNKYFNRKYVETITGSKAKANTLINQYLKEGSIIRARHNLYVTIDKTLDIPSLNAFQLGSILYNDAYISYQSAFELHGCYVKDNYNVYVSTIHPFKEFEFCGKNICYAKSAINHKLIENNKCKYSSIEQTIIDSIKALSNAYPPINMETLVECLYSIPSNVKIDENILLEYLKKYKSATLYQKCGYILEFLKNELKIPESFFTICQRNMSNKKIRIDKMLFDTYSEKWKIFGPSHLCLYISKGMPEELFLGKEIL